MESKATIKERKRTLRRFFVDSILAMPPRERLSQESWLRENVFLLPGFSAAATVLLYARAFPEEVDLDPLIEKLLGKNGRVVLPRVDGLSKGLRLFDIEDPVADLQPGLRGIPEPRAHCREVDPRAIDWALIPGLGFDDRCFRLGRGAGHYDRLLPRLAPQTPRWAIGFLCQLVHELPVEIHDLPMHGILLPGRFIDRAGRGTQPWPPETSTSTGIT